MNTFIQLIRPDELPRHRHRPRGRLPAWLGSAVPSSVQKPYAVLGGGRHRGDHAVFLREGEAVLVASYQGSGSSPPIPASPPLSSPAPASSWHLCLIAGRGGGDSEGRAMQQAGEPGVGKGVW